MTDEELDDALYDLLLVGHYYLAQADLTKAVCEAYQVLGALSQSNCYLNLLRPRTTMRTGFRDRVRHGAHIVKAEPRTRATPQNMAVEALTAPRTALQVMMVRPRCGSHELDPALILGAEGYPLSFTPAGRAYAAVAAQQRYQELTADDIAAGAARFGSLPKYRRRAGM